MSIHLYTHGTPNGHKVSIMLEELGLPYTHEVVEMTGAQFEPKFVALNPNSKIPTIVDRDGPDGQPITVFESGAILLYLAKKMGSDLLPSEPRAESVVTQWLMFQMASVGPMFGQAGHFWIHSTEEVPYGRDRYLKELKRLAKVMDDRLANSTYLAGDTYTIADIATYPWTNSGLKILLKADPDGGGYDAYPNVKRWRAEIEARPAVQRGLKVPDLG